MSCDVTFLPFLHVKLIMTYSTVNHTSSPIALPRPHSISPRPLPRASSLPTSSRDGEDLSSPPTNYNKKRRLSDSDPEPLPKRPRGMPSGPGPYIPSDPLPINEVEGVPGLGMTAGDLSFPSISTEPFNPSDAFDIGLCTQDALPNSDSSLYTNLGVFS